MVARRSYVTRLLAFWLDADENQSAILPDHTHLPLLPTRNKPEIKEERMLRYNRWSHLTRCSKELNLLQ
jgi:hypothetical protein